jgi:hypothetical protein
MTLLKLDFDKPIPRDFAGRLRFVSRVHGLRYVWRCDRRTAHGWHVTLAVAGRVALWRVVLLQAVCGSDWRRETYNAARVVVARQVDLVWRERINVLYKRHYRHVRGTHA